MDLHSAFQEATAAVRNIPNIDTTSMLRLYGLYKQANHGPCNTPKPGIFNITSREKWQAWNSCGSMSQTDAMTDYIDLVHSLDGSSKGFDKGWKAVSCMAHEQEVSDEDKTIFDWVKDGNKQRVSNMIESEPQFVNETDESGMFLIHWAADRGDVEMIELLINGGSLLNVIDDAGQTPLHYASACGHRDCINLLKTKGADESIRDHDGLLASELIEL